MPFISINDLEPRQLIPGYFGRFIHSHNMSVAYWNIQAGHKIPRHSHPHEMIVNCLEGEFEFTVGEETRLMKAGDVAIVPSNIPHNGFARTDCKCIDIFNPVREDYKL
ncbi:MAG: cupin domain-containing protein [Crinalium sp.]